MSSAPCGGVAALVGMTTIDLVISTEAKRSGEISEFRSTTNAPRSPLGTTIDAPQ